MTLEELTRYLESLLFVSAEPAELTHLAGALDVTTDEIEAALAALDAQCANRGIRVQRRGTRVQLATASAASPYVEKFLGLTATTRLSQAALETLAIIAYRQPITRAEIEALRGVDCDGVLRTLVARQLIGELERLDTVGHPIRYGTTFEFMRYFGLQRLEDLPPLRTTEVPTQKDVAVPDTATLASPMESHDEPNSEAKGAPAGNSTAGDGSHAIDAHHSATDVEQESNSAGYLATNVGPRPVGAELPAVADESAPASDEPQPLNAQPAATSAESQPVNAEPAAADVEHKPISAEHMATNVGPRPFSAERAHTGDEPPPPSAGHAPPGDESDAAGDGFRPPA